VYKPIKEIIPMVDPCEFVISGWDISSENLYKACKRSKVLEPDLINKLQDDLESIIPLPGALNSEYIASNQADRADNVL
jgi:myo-inositol-1-phosphate synthase